MDLYVATSALKSSYHTNLASFLFDCKIMCKPLSACNVSLNTRYTRNIIRVYFF